ncbi:hypothetical protein GOODEAATRI_013844 [Goodea atripinnis]|uniref:Uncharacterized protein n=1 Tax=Goodea atripinnis TaxID=208336 RepID=A0ABV0NUQ6_9TELE
MSRVLDETATDLPVRDMTVNLSRLTEAPQDPSVHQHARERQNIGKLSREELEDRFLRVHEETLQLKQHIHTQDEKIKKLGTKLMKLVKDRGRMEQLAAGAAQPLSRFRDLEMEEMVEELQEKVRGLQAENEGLKQRLVVAKQQIINSQSRRQTQYEHVHSRVNSGLKKLRDDSSSPSPGRQRSESKQENVVECQRSHMDELEGVSEQLREELRRKEEDFEEKLLQARQQQTSTLRSQVNSNMSMIKLQKQLADRSNTVTELESRYRLLQEVEQIFSQKRKSQKSGDLSFLVDMDEDGRSNTESSIRELRAAHAETIQELEKTRNLLNMESRISKDYKVEKGARRPGNICPDLSFLI